MLEKEKQEWLNERWKDYVLGCSEWQKYIILSLKCTFMAFCDTWERKETLFFGIKCIYYYFLMEKAPLIKIIFLQVLLMLIFFANVFRIFCQIMLRKFRLLKRD